MRSTLLALLLVACDTPGEGVVHEPTGCGHCSSRLTTDCFNCGGGIQTCVNWTDWTWSICAHNVDGLCFGANGESFGACVTRPSLCPADNGPGQPCGQ